MTTTTADVRRAFVQHAARIAHPPVPAADAAALFDEWLATITRPEPREMTAEELDALPAGTIVMDRGGEPWLCCSYDGSCWEGLEAVMTPRALIRLSPLRVIYVPEGDA